MAVGVDMRVDSTFPALLRRYRADRSLRQLDLGRRIAEQAHLLSIGLPPVSRQTIARWERGQAPTDLYAVLLARVMGVSPAELGRAIGRQLTAERVEEVIRSAASRRRTSVAARRPGANATVDWERLMRRLRAVIEEDLGIDRHQP